MDTGILVAAVPALVVGQWPLAKLLISLLVGAYGSSGSYSITKENI